VFKNLIFVSEIWFRAVEQGGMVACEVNKLIYTCMITDLLICVHSLIRDLIIFAALSQFVIIKLQLLYDLK